MTEPTEPTGSGAPAPGKKKPTPLLPGVILLGLAAVLMIIVVINPDMPSGLRTGIAIFAVVVVLALLAYACIVWLALARNGRNR